MNYYRRYVGDYLRDTARLSMLEHGAYNLLLDYYYADEKALPLDKDELYLMVRAMSGADRKAIDKILRLYFTEEPDGYHQKRVDREIAVSTSARTNGKGGGRPPKDLETGLITGSETGIEPNSKPESKPLTQTGLQTETLTGSGHPPTTNHQPPASTHQPPEKTPRKRDAPSLPNSDELLADVSPQVRGDWLAIRRAKRLPFTQTAMNGIRSEVGKAGLTMQAALEICCRRGWGSFENAWDWRETSGKNGMSPYQQMQVEKHEEAKRFTEAIHGKRNDGPRDAIDVTPERVD